MAQDSKYLTITEESFAQDVLENDRPVLVDFWASWCGPCHVVAPAVEELAEEFQDTATVGKINVDEQGKLAERFGVQSIPTLLFFKNGKIVDRAVGAVPKQVLASKLNALLAA